MRRKTDAPFAVLLTLCAACGGSPDTVGPGGSGSGEPASLEISSGNTSLDYGEGTQFVAVVRDAAGRLLSGVSVAWSSDDETVLQIAASGRALATAVGTARLTARSGSVSRTITVTASPLRFTSVSAGWRHACAVTDSGAVYCWGLNLSGALGNGTIEYSALPVRVDTEVTFATVSASENPHHTCALTADGEAYCWGLKLPSQLGGPHDEYCLHDRDYPCWTRPTRVEGSVRFVKLVAGGDFSCGISTDRQAFCWGNGFRGRLGDGTDQPKRDPHPVAIGEDVIDLDTGAEHACAITVTNVAWCWGGNRMGELGIGPPPHQPPLDCFPDVNCSYTPRRVLGGLQFQQIRGGSQFTCGLTTGGDAYCWGENEWGQLGNGATKGYPGERSPVRVVSGGFATVDAGGWAQACALTPAGSALCWGANGSGQLGDGTTTSRLVPTAVSGGHRWLEISTGGGIGRTCGLADTGLLYCWGDGHRTGTGMAPGELETTPTLVFGQQVG